MKKEEFKVFNDAFLGQVFMPDGLSNKEIKALHISPIHGRAVALNIGEYKWITVKGGGWNYGGPQIYISKKDEELVFGLYSRNSAIRELAVSREIEKFSTEFPKVLYYKSLCDVELPQKYNYLKKLKFKNGQLVNPCLLYTQIKSPFRVADLIYLTEDEKESIVNYCCKYWGISTSDYSKTFIEKLASHVAILHKNGFINDTLDYGNVTMMAEIIDYEWVTAPGIKLFDGTYGLEITDERREKEILYGTEVCLQLKAMLHMEYNFFDIYEEFIESYSKINPRLLKENPRVQKILNREEVVL